MNRQIPLTSAESPENPEDRTPEFAEIRELVISMWLLNTPGMTREMAEALYGDEY